MLIDRLLPGCAAVRRALLCLLLLGLLLHAQAGVLRQLLGAAHWHAPADAAQQAGWLDGARAWRQQLLAHRPLAGAHADAGHQHHHGGSARHHHGADDTSVVALEPGDAGQGSLSDGAAGSLLQPLGLAGPLGWLAGSQAGQGWPHAATPDWRSAGNRQPERPPRG